jgi:hypothetical protein
VSGELATLTLLRTLSEVQSTTTARERRRAVQRAAVTLGLSEQTVYRRLGAMGWSSGRAARADRGQSRMSEADRLAMAQIMAQARNKRGQANLPMTEVVRIAAETGLVEQPVSAAHLGRLLRRDHLDHTRMGAAHPAIQRVSTHPNHVWFFDISVAIQWYFRDDAGKKLDLYGDGDARFYEGKRQNIAAARRIIHRFMMVDHRSGAYYARYYYSAGEAAEDVVDFLTRAMGPKAMPEHYPFRGVPKRMVMDQGSANKSALVRNLLDELGVDVELHAAGNARASGSVESRHNHWQRTFEGRLAVRPVNDLAELNDLAERFAATANADATRLHSRHGRPPMEAWLDITQEQLVEAPLRALMLQLATTTARPATLTAQGWLRAGGRTWQVQGAGVYSQQKVTYRLSPFLPEGIRVWDGEGVELTATELRFDSAGFTTNGLAHEWDNAERPGASAPMSAARKLNQAVRAGEHVAPDVDPWADLRQLEQRQEYLSRQGTEWAPATTATAASAAPLLDSIQAREQVIHQLGRSLTREEAGWWKARVGDGITGTDLQAALIEFQSPQTCGALHRNLA